MAKIKVDRRYRDRSYTYIYEGMIPVMAVTQDALTDRYIIYNKYEETDHNTHEVGVISKIARLILEFE
jgi:hypothetical protein